MRSHLKAGSRQELAHGNCEGGTGIRRFTLHHALLLLLSVGGLLLAGCGKKEAPPETPQQPAPQQASSQPLVPSENTGKSATDQGELVLPASFGKRTDDLDEQRSIRVLVIVSPIGFFYRPGNLRESSTKHFRSLRSSSTRNFQLFSE